MADNYRKLNVSANQIEEAVTFVDKNKVTISEGLNDVQNNKHDISELQGAMSNVYSKEETNELLNDKPNTEDVYSRSETDSLLSAKADKNNTYTKAETDTKITEKVSEIVAGAPEDFDTLKEMSDWLEAHEDSAAAMNSDIQKNKTDISLANAEIAKKVDKVSGKSLIADSEIERLKSVDNYDDTSINTQIADIYDNYIGGKNLLNPDKHTINRCTETKDGNTYTVTSTGTWSQWYWRFTGRTGQKYILSFEISELTGDTSKNDIYIKDLTSDTSITNGSVRDDGSKTIEFTAISDSTIQIAWCPNNSTNDRDLSFKVSNLMCRPTTIKSKSYAPYRPTNAELQDQITAYSPLNNSLQLLSKATAKQSGYAPGWYKICSISIRNTYDTYKLLMVHETSLTKASFRFERMSEEAYANLKVAASGVSTVYGDNFGQLGFTYNDGTLGIYMYTGEQYSNLSFRILSYRSEQNINRVDAITIIDNPVKEETTPEFLFTTVTTNVISNFEARIAALEGTATTAEGGEA